ncbi:hypothetical protein HHI36_008351, partial [Cryptolaemus montrouzieri]
MLKVVSYYRTESSDRLPLRDAVESRILPYQTHDEFTQDEARYNHDQGTYPTKSDQTEYLQNGFYYQPSYYSINGRLALEKANPPYNRNFQDQGSIYYNQNPFLGRNSYSPVETFQTLINDYRKTSPYRVDNEFQQLLIYPNHWNQGNILNPILARNLNNQEKITPNERRIVCYVQGRAVYRREPQNFHPEDLNPFACSHVIYAFAALDPHSFQIVPNDEEYDLIQ